jgi:hypothetical protein
VPAEEEEAEGQADAVDEVPVEGSGAAETTDGTVAGAPTEAEAETDADAVLVDAVTE